MEFSYRTTAYLESLQNKLISSEWKIVGFDWSKNAVCINKVDVWKKRNGKTVSVHHKFRTWVEIPSEMIKWRKVTHKGYNRSWVWADNPEYTYERNEKYIIKGDAKKILETYKTLPKINPYKSQEGEKP